MLDVTNCAGPDEGPTVPFGVFANASSISKVLDLSSPTLFGLGPTISDVVKADVGDSGPSTFDVRQSGVIRTSSLAVAVVSVIIAVEWRIVVDSDDRSTGGLALVVSFTLASSRVH